MIDKDYLNVWYGKEIVGRIWRNTAGIIGFSYEQDWLRTGFAISQQLPLVGTEFTAESGIAHLFFVNLLPEANARSHIVKALKISDEDYEVLKALGGECAGALSILPATSEPSGKYHYKKFAAGEFKKLLLRKGLPAFNADNEAMRPRLSLAGAQDKCPIFFNGDNFLLSQYDAPSTHILKFEMNHYRNIPVYEYFLTKLAKAIGLPVVDVQLRKYDEHYYLLIKRYDRIQSNELQVKRLHQEDFCQALGIGYERKYQQGGGVAFEDCYKLVQAISSNPIRDNENLLRWQIFNVLAGNSDGHAKNLALLYTSNNNVELAPFYDLVCTRAIDGLDTRLALSVGKEFEPSKIALKHWEELATSCNIRKQFLLKIVVDTISALLDNLPLVYTEFEQEFGSYPALQRVKRIVTKQCKSISAKLKHGQA